MPERLVVICVTVGVVAGAIFGFVRGLDHTPTLAFAVVEGAILFGIPAGVLGALLAIGWKLSTSVRRRTP